jgi:hypothetical protein
MNEGNVGGSEKHGKSEVKNNGEKNLDLKRSVLWKSGWINTKYIAGPTLLSSTTYFRPLARSASLTLAHFVPCDRLICPSWRMAAKLALKCRHTGLL